MTEAQRERTQGGVSVVVKNSRTVARVMRTSRERLLSRGRLASLRFLRSYESAIRLARPSSERGVRDKPVAFRFAPENALSRIAGTSQDTERLIRKQFGSIFLPTDALKNVSCHESVCKIEIFWTPRRSAIVVSLAMTLRRLLTNHIALEPAVELDSQGRLLVKMYIVRAGYDVANMQ
jgi:hypothetical protein